MPGQKTDHIRRLVAEHHCIGRMGMVCMMRSRLPWRVSAFAMDPIGSDAAIETAVMKLMKDDLTSVEEAIT